MANRFDITESELRELYLDRGYSIRECAEYYGGSTSLIEFKLSEYDIDTRPPGSSPVQVTRGRLKELYIDQGLTTIEIADRLDCHPSTVGKKLNHYGISTTGPNHGRSIQVDEDRLRQLYLEEGQTTYQIAERFECDPTVIERRLRWYGIEIRHTDAGEDSWEYKYGAGWRSQRRKALERADHQCERCGITDDEHRKKYVEPTRCVGFGLDVHHRVNVRVFKRWDLPIEDANRLSNLDVLCQSCHRDFGDRVGTVDTGVE